MYKAQAAKFLADLRFSGRVEEDFPAQLRPKEAATAYAIQDALIEHLVAQHGGHPVGYKIACTNASAQELLNTDAPVYGRLLSSFVHRSPARLDASDFTFLGIETEFAFKIAEDLPLSGVKYNPETISQYIHQAFPAIEIVHHRFSGWDKFDAFSLIADNAIHGAWISGSPAANWQNLDLAAHEVCLMVNNAVKAKGQGKAVLGHPLIALAWLANELPRWGRSLKKGELVTTGTCTNVYTAAPGDVIRADFGSLGHVDLAFDT